MCLTSAGWMEAGKYKSDWELFSNEKILASVPD